MTDGSPLLRVRVSRQEPTLLPDLSVAENLAIGPRPLCRFNTIDQFNF